MLKRTCIALIILTSYLFANNLKAQTPAKDTAMYEYAILQLTYGFSKNLNVIFESNQSVKKLDLDEKLNLDTLGGGTITTRYYQYLFIGMHYLEKMGYELVSHTPNQYGNYCMYRKKRVK